MAVAGTAVLLSVAHARRIADTAFNAEVHRAVETARVIEKDRNAIQLVDIPVKRGTNFAVLLQEAGLDSAQAAEATHAAQDVWNLRHIIPGHRMWAERSQSGDVKSVVYRIDNDRELWLNRDGTDFSASVRQVPSTTRVVTVSGKIHDSLFESMAAAGEQPELAVRFAEILAWDVDFYTDPREGDDFSLVVEKKEYNGGGSYYGRIFAVRYDNAGHVHDAVLFHDEHGNPAYYTAEGKSLQKEFLRSPLKFAARISSHFSRARFHPILKIYRAHLGTDYAAPIGTPVQAVASGRVEFAGRKGGDGNMVKLAHSNGYETMYLHLSRILVHRGAHVQQGERIGLVGMTGLATGPHLDFRIERRGSFVNFEHMKIQPSTPVAKRLLPEFETVRDKYVAMLTSNNGTAVAQNTLAPDPAADAASK